MPTIELRCVEPAPQSIAFYRGESVTLRFTMTPPLSIAGWPLLFTCTHTEGASRWMTGARAGSSADRAGDALQGVNPGRSCPGCGQPFQPRRDNQRHCRPSCRVLAWRKRHSAEWKDGDGKV